MSNQKYYALEVWNHDLSDLADQVTTPMSLKNLCAAMLGVHPNDILKHVPDIYNNDDADADDVLDGVRMSIARGDSHWFVAKTPQDLVTDLQNYFKLLLADEEFDNDDEATQYTDARAALAQLNNIS